MDLPPKRTPATHRTSALAWLLVWALLIVYASLYPFEGWRLSAGTSAWQMLSLPWPRWRVPFDEIANLLGYLPLGMLACYGAMRMARKSSTAWGLAVLVAAVLSYAVEVTQGLMPMRVPSLKDTAFNVTGAAIGAAMAVVLIDSGTLSRTRTALDTWFDRRGAWSLMLLLFWPVGLLFPSPVPLGLGHGLGALAAWFETVVEDTPLQAWVGGWLTAVSGGQTVGEALATQHEIFIVAFGLLAPCLVAYATTHGAWRRVALALGALGLALLVTTLSVALTFGPEHGLAWFTPAVLKGLAAGFSFALLCVAMPSREAAWLGVVVVVCLVVAVSMAPADPYYAAFLSTWEQGQFIHFHGAAQWVGWLWPYAALVWLVSRGFRMARF